MGLTEKIAVYNFGNEDVISLEMEKVFVVFHKNIASS